MTSSPQQIRMFLKYAQSHTQQIAAAKAGISWSTAKRYLKKMKEPPLPKSSKPKRGRTRPDPFAEVWPFVRELLERDPGLEAKTLMQWLLETHPGRFSPGQERTLRRRVRDWRVLEGPEKKEIMFLQTIHPGKQSQSDYTHCTSLAVTIDGELFVHLLYHYMLPYSRWEYVWVCFTESFETLTTGFSKAVKALGAVAPDHRTDNLAAAVPIGQHGLFQKRWEDFLEHYGAKPSANNPEKSNENGSVEKSHDLFKHALDQRLRMRGSRDFKTRQAYESFVQDMMVERNRQRKERLAEELPLLKPLPATTWKEAQEFSCLVTAWSTVRIAGATYSVPSRYIGQKLRALAYFATVEVYYGNHLIHTAERKGAGEKCINYRHLIFHLLRKPGAFRNYQFREELFPRVIFRRAYDKLFEDNEDKADKEYLLILHQAAVGSETETALALEILLEQGTVPSAERLRQLTSLQPKVPEVSVHQPSLKRYDSLLKLTKPTRKETNQ